MREKSPLIVTLVGVLAFFGLISSSGTNSSDIPKSKSNLREAAASEPEVMITDSELPAFLSPLRDYFGFQPEKKPIRIAEAKPAALNHEAEKKSPVTELLNKIADSDYDIEFLIATIPDPISSPFGDRFDLLSDVIQRAIEAQKDAVLDRSWLPWKQGGRARKSSEDLRLHERFPGTLLFRVNPEFSHKTGHLLVLFLVGDTPTAGIQKEAMANALRVVCQAPGFQSSRTVRLLGPNFSGSQTSLEIALTEWSKKNVCMKNPVNFHIISGSATSIDKARLENRLNGCPGVQATFHATVLPNSVVMDEMIEYIRERDSRVTKIALLREANTGYGGKAAPKDPKTKRENLKIIDLPFPLFISRLRTAYTKNEGEKHNEDVTDKVKPTKLRVPLDDSGSFEGDPLMFPELTSAQVDHILAQILETVAQENIRYVGILATDVRDKLFLIRKLRAFSPDVQLFTVIGNNLFGHADFRRDTYGMLVASTYPLWPRNQHHVGNSLTRFNFSDQGDVGVFNATILLLDGCEKVREYWPPGVESSGVSRPPVWISAVGRNGVWPIATRIPADNNRAYEEYVREVSPPERGVVESPISWFWVSALSMMLVVMGGMVYWAWDFGVCEPARGHPGLLAEGNTSRWEQLVPPCMEKPWGFLCTLLCVILVACFCFYVSLVSFPRRTLPQLWALIAFASSPSLLIALRLLLGPKEYFPKLVRIVLFGVLTLFAVASLIVTVHLVYTENHPTSISLLLEGLVIAAFLFLVMIGLLRVFFLLDMAFAVPIYPCAALGTRPMGFPCLAL